MWKVKGNGEVITVYFSLSVEASRKGCVLSLLPALRCINVEGQGAVGFRLLACLYWNRERVLSLFYSFPDRKEK